jgi:hypothetical protein
VRGGEETDAYLGSARKGALFLMGLISLIRSLLKFSYDVFFGCRHRNQTRPFTLKRQTYKVCLDCGTQIFYSPERMTPLTAREVRRAEAAAAGLLTLVPSGSHGSRMVGSSGDKSNAVA